jgi:hypothetical protein
MGPWVSVGGAGTIGEMFSLLCWLCLAQRGLWTAVATEGALTKVRGARETVATVSAKAEGTVGDCASEGRVQEEGFAALRLASGGEGRMRRGAAEARLGGG